MKSLLIGAWRLNSCLVKGNKLLWKLIKLKSKIPVSRRFWIGFLEFSFSSSIQLLSLVTSCRQWLLVMVFLNLKQVITSVYLQSVIGVICKLFFEGILDASDAEINETISKCGINQEIIQKSCGDGKIESSTLYLLMGIFRLWSST